MSARRVLVMVHASLVPPATLAGRRRGEIDEWRTEFDVVRALRAAGAEVRVIGVLDSLGDLQRQIERWRPHVVFNLLEEFDGIIRYESHVVGWLELMRQPYTGCNPRGLMLARDKVLGKRLLASHGIPTPAFALIERGARFRAPRGLRPPFIVKSATEDASLGIAQASVVRDERRLRERVAFIHARIGTDALVEEYVRGRELYVGVLGNRQLTVLPPWEMRFGRLPAAQAAIATRRVKWNRVYRRRHRIGTGPAHELEGDVARRLADLARRIYRVLHLSGCARVDFRLHEDGTLFALEANPNPNLAREEDFAASARAGGLDYPQLMERIVRLGLGYAAEWRR